MHFFFLSCLRATALIEKKFHFELSYKEKIQLKLHTMMCDACSMYEDQSEVIEHGIQKHFHEKQTEPTNTKTLKKQIQDKLQGTLK